MLRSSLYLQCERQSRSLIYLTSVDLKRLIVYSVVQRAVASHELTLLTSPCYSTAFFLGNGNYALYLIPLGITRQVTEVYATHNGWSRSRVGMRGSYRTIPLPPTR